MLTLTPPRIDLDAASLRLVAEVEDYLRTVAHPAAPTLGGPGLDLVRLMATGPAPCRYGQVLQQWHAAVTLPEPTLLDRIRGHHPVADVTVGQHLDLVSRYIHQHGWIQGALWNDAGAVCILGAQLRVLAAGYGTAAVVERARELIGNQLGYQREGMPVDVWNDQPHRRVADVHQLLQRAAARA